ncbi:MAG: 16S rRNA (adenine(1518)-N(6)/adenine(1519)-N(6))-dimethyltransferase RsmA [Pseudomonadota bacterium]
MNRPRKRFGQHFLHDTAVIARIVAAIDPRPGQTLVEIGPGPGALTAPLAAAGVRLHALEIDRELAAALRQRFAGNADVSIETADALEVNFGRFGTRLRCVGNLPYNISTPLLFHLGRFDGIADMHFMLQKEVVERMAAAPGSRTYGRLSVMLQSRWQVVSLFDVGPGAFRPPPKVHSSIVRLSPLARPPVIADPVRFDAIVRAAFSQRRKTLKNALKDLLSAADIERAGVDPGCRAETLDIRQFVELSCQTPYKVWNNNDRP